MQISNKPSHVFRKRLMRNLNPDPRYRTYCNVLYCTKLYRYCRARIQKVKDEREKRKKSIRPNLQNFYLTLIFQGILFGLCQFHAVMVERKKFGPKGFNLQYPFSVGDLVNSSSVLRNYMESAPAKVPWQDLRYLFGTLQT